MTDRIGADISELQTASSQFLTGAGNLEQLLSQVKGQMEILGSSWTGQAAADFQSLMEQWSSDVQSIHQIITTVSQNLGKSANAIVELDQNLKGGFQL